MFSTALCLLALHAGTGSRGQATTPRNMFQIGTLQALLDGKYDGTTPMKKLLEHGDFGVGTFQDLNGEMVVVDGKIYQGDSFGDANILPPDTTTPFGCVEWFKADITVPITKPMTSSELMALIDRKVGNSQTMLAIRLDGRFTNTTLRAFRPQFKPYIPLAKLGGYEARFTYPTIDGTFAGNRLPKSMGALNVAGYHFHCINDKRTRAGHVLAYSVDSGTLKIMKLDKIVLSK